MGELQGDQSANRFRDDDTESNGDREFEVAVESEQDQEDQENSERADDVKLCLGVQQFTVFAAPIEAVTLRQMDALSDVFLTGVDNAFEIAPLNRKLDADVARVVLTVDERGAGGFLDGGELGKRNLLASRARNEEISDFAGVGPKLGIHAHDEIEQLFSLNHLGGGLSADRGLHDGLHIGDVDAVAGNSCTIGLDEQTGLAQFANDREFGVARRFFQHTFDLDGLFLENVEVGAENFHGERRFEAC